MSARKTVSLRLEALSERILPSANPVASPTNFLTIGADGAVATPPADGTGPYVGPVGGPYQSGGIEPINPINPIPIGGGGGGGGVGGQVVMPAINPAKEAAILNNLRQADATNRAALAALDPTGPDFAELQADLEHRQSMIDMATQCTQQMMANVLVFANLSAQAAVIEARLAAFQTNPATTPEQLNEQLGLLTQYRQLHAQMTALVNTTAQLFGVRNQLLGYLGIPSGY